MDVLAGKPFVVSLRNNLDSKQSLQIAFYHSCVYLKCFLEGGWPFNPQLAGRIDSSFTVLGRRARIAIARSVVSL